MSQTMKYSEDQIIKILEREYKESGLSFTDFAKSKNVSKQYLRGVLMRSFLPGPKIGFQKVEGSLRFVRIGE